MEKNKDRKEFSIGVYAIIKNGKRVANCIPPGFSYVLFAAGKQQYTEDFFEILNINFSAEPILIRIKKWRNKKTFLLGCIRAHFSCYYALNQKSKNKLQGMDNFLP